MTQKRVTPVPELPYGNTVRGKNCVILQNFMLPRRAEPIILDFIKCIKYSSEYKISQISNYCFDRKIGSRNY